MMLSLNNKFLRQRKTFQNFMGNIFIDSSSFVVHVKELFQNKQKLCFLISSPQSPQRILNSVLKVIYSQFSVHRVNDRSWLQALFITADRRNFFGASSLQLNGH